MHTKVVSYCINKWICSLFYLFHQRCICTSNIKKILLISEKMKRHFSGHLDKENFSEVSVAIEKSDGQGL
jgi:hypothetical protein